MNRVHPQSEPQTSFGSSSQHMSQQQPQHNNSAQVIFNRLFAYGDNNGQFDSTLLLNGGQPKFDFLNPNLQSHPNHLMQNGALLGGGGAHPRGNGTTSMKKKKGAGPGRRPALDANGQPKERPFTCPREDCHKSFCRNDHLQRHMRIHTGQRLFQCRTCLRSFSRSDHLAKHERTHSADKPYSCLTCARRFHKHEEKKKHEEKCQHKPDEQSSSRANQQQLNLMGQQPIWGGAQNQMILNGSMQSPNSSNLMMIPTQFSKNGAPGATAGSNSSPLEIRSLIAGGHNR